MARFVGLALVALAIWYCGVVFDGLPAPQGLDAPPTEFSAARADATLGRLLGPEVPHPISSKANQAVRDRIRAEFTALGIKTSIYRATGCNARPAYGFFACGTAEDVIAEVAPGAGKAIVLVAHYDSVPAGPGASDDQSGVATILETVRALKARGLKTKHPILALLSDGEEAGLLGAVAFLDNPALRARVGIAVNAEARGNQGPSLLFQTSPGDGKLIDLYAHAVPQFATSSLFAVIYKALPNDTDLTVFLEHGIAGYNFAFSGDVADYHTPRDRRANLSLATLQHHGDNVLGVASALMQSDFAALRGGDDIYLSLYGHVLPRMPAGWAVPLAILVLALLFAASRLSRGEVLGVGRRLAAFAIVPAAMLGSAAIGWLLFEIAALVSRQPDPSFAHPVWLRIALFLGIAAVMAAVSRLASTRMTVLSVWFWMASLALLTAIFLPGLSPYFLFPSLIAAPLLVIGLRREGVVAEATIFLVALPALAIWLSLAALAESTEGLALHPLFTLPVAFGVMPLLGLLAGKRMAWTRIVSGSAAAAMFFAIVAGLQPAYSAKAPQRLDIDFIDDHIANKASWGVETDGRLPRSFRTVAPFSADRVEATPVAFARAYVSPAGAPRFAAPGATVASKPSGAGRVVTLALHGSPLANRIVLLVPKDAGLLKAQLDGKSFVPSPTTLNPYGTVLVCSTDDCRSKSITLTFASRRPLEVLLGEQHYGLPPDGAKLLRARPASAVASHTGDSTIVFGRLKL